MREVEQIVGLFTLPYDYSKVKEFTLTSKDGSTLRVVSKRLSPIKSITAEKEFAASKVLHRLGVRVPTPIGIIKDRGNTYFLWRKVEGVGVGEVKDAKARSEIKKQYDEIISSLDKNGITHMDIADRNLIVTFVYGKPLLWLLDMERMEIPKKLMRLAA